MIPDCSLERGSVVSRSVAGLISILVHDRIAGMLGENILAVYPHRRRSSEIRFTPPMGLEYVMAAVEDLVKRITIVDMRLEDEYDLTRFIDSRTDAVCISLNWAPSKPEGGAVPEFDLINRLPRHLRTVVGGRWASMNTDAVFENCPNVDIVVQGDGEETIRELATRTSPAEITGLAYRSDGVIHRNPPRRLAPLSETLCPNRKLRRYAYTVAARGIDLGITVDSVLSSQGCPFHCKFCAYNADWLGRRRPWQARSPQSVLNELHDIDADVVFFADNNFCVDMDRVGAICDLVIKEGIRKTFALEARVDIARRPDVLDKMARAGFRIIMFGLESACDESLRLLNKGFTVADVRAAFNVFRRYPFLLGGFFIVGNIGESEHDMLRMSAFARELGVDFISLSYLRADRGSSLEDLVQQSPGYHIAHGEKPKVYSEKYPLEKLGAIKHAIARDFYSSTYMIGRLVRGLSAGILKPRHLWSIVRSVLIVAARALLPRRLRRRLKPPGGQQ
jgi:anaerobic magnesium-protoporphyrin IX monomethyl ester cyclase